MQNVKYFLPYGIFGLKNLQCMLQCCSNNDLNYKLHSKIILTTFRESPPQTWNSGMQFAKIRLTNRSNLQRVASVVDNRLVICASICLNLLQFASILVSGANSVEKFKKSILKIGNEKVDPNVCINKL